MNNTIVNTKETVTSMEVAQMVDKEHSKLLRDIRRYINQINKVNEDKVALSENGQDLGKAKIGFTDFFYGIHIY